VLPYCRLAAAIAFMVLMPSAAFSQDVTEPALKAAFIYNFVKFTEWPEPRPASDPFVICVLNDAAVADALGRIVKGREFAGRRMVVSLAAPGPKERCRVVYISGVTESEGAQLLSPLRDSPVLTIGDLEWFTRAGGMAQFFYEHGKLRFNIGLEAVKRSRLLMSSKVLVLAKQHE
jgi:hypothetical protein